MTDAFGVNKSLADVVRGVRGGAKTASKVKLIPAQQPAGSTIYVHWDPAKAKALATQKERYATRMSFGSRS